MFVSCACAVFCDISVIFCCVLSTNLFFKGRWSCRCGAVSSMSRVLYDVGWTVSCVLYDVSYMVGLCVYFLSLQVGIVLLCGELVFALEPNSPHDCSCHGTFTACLQHSSYHNWHPSFFCVFPPGALPGGGLGGTRLTSQLLLCVAALPIFNNSSEASCDKPPI